MKNTDNFNEFFIIIVLVFNDFYCNESDYLGLFRDAYISASMLFLNFLQYRNLEIKSAFRSTRNDYIILSLLFQY